MREQAKITSKGQITVPRKVRHALGVKPGDSLVFEQDGDNVRIRPVKIKSPFAKYRGIGNPGMATGRQAVLRKIGQLRGHETQTK